MQNNAVKLNHLQPCHKFRGLKGKIPKQRSDNILILVASQYYQPAEFIERWLSLRRSFPSLRYLSIFLSLLKVVHTSRNRNFKHHWPSQSFTWDHHATYFYCSGMEAAEAFNMCRENIVVKKRDFIGHNPSFENVYICRKPHFENVPIGRTSAFENVHICRKPCIENVYISRKPSFESGACL